MTLEPCGSGLRADMPPDASDDRTEEEGAGAEDGGEGAEQEGAETERERSADGASQADGELRAQSQEPMPESPEDDGNGPGLGPDRDSTPHEESQDTGMDTQDLRDTERCARLI
ncbi:RNA polymerase II-associated factor 1 homolog [Megalops cyprinoides]|uniref:RNA polymerase II-associated factor 1 homolog n=1 Tax=Megalops cyprinoides TaxID=118141 RepID=UPI001864C9ED|nr:RNA polymerase II-associated factor 1 homolog [Megalops cyprinoides]